MIEITNDCVACDWPSCAGCRLPETPHYYCDDCGMEVESYEELFGDNGEELCLDCYRAQYEE